MLTFKRLLGRAPRSALGIVAVAFGALMFSVTPALAGGSQQATVSGVHFKMTHGRVYITYNLIGDPTAEYRVSVVLRNGDDAGYEYTPKSLKGDVGVGRYAGPGRQIVWAISNEFPDGLPGSDYYFVVSAKRVNKSSGPGLFAMVGTGVAVVAAAVTYLVISGLHSQSPHSPGLPAPPGRP